LLFVLFFLLSVAPAVKYSVWSAEGLPSMIGAAGQQAWQTCGVVAHLFFQCTMVWRSLPRAMCSGCRCFSSPFCFTSAQCVSSVSARSLIHEVHAVCVCAPVTILDPPTIDFFSPVIFLNSNSNGVSVIVSVFCT
jgi:hypothetical protein